MINIEQLLESVDLDFEPRFVTKDESGEICIWDEHKPVLDNDIWNWDSPDGCNYVCLGSLKLSEFADKPWQECIYEVPRKTTGKIEKLKEITSIGYPESATHEIILELNKIIKKQNELVVAVNKHADIIQQIGDWGTRKGECLWCETLTKFEPNELKGVKNE